MDELVKAIEDYKEKRRKVREALEGLGFKVEGMYMRREEAEKIIEEAKRRRPRRSSTTRGYRRRRG